MTAGLVSAEGVDVVRGGRPVLNGVSVSLSPGWTAIVGPNGAGKSTLLRVLMGLQPAERGTVMLEGRSLSGWRLAERARRMAWLAQQGEASGELTGRESPAERVAGSVAAHLIAAQNGAKIVRVHDVAATVDALKVWNAVAAVPLPRKEAAKPAIRWPDDE